MKESVIITQNKKSPLDKQVSKNNKCFSIMIMNNHDLSNQDYIILVFEKQIFQDERRRLYYDKVLF